MDVLMLNLCCVPNRELLCGSLRNDKIKLDVLVRAQCSLPNSYSMWNGNTHVLCCQVLYLLL